MPVLEVYHVVSILEALSRAFPLMCIISPKNDYGNQEREDKYII